MGRLMKMRGIRPDFWVDEGVVSVGPFARLLFIGLWQMACDNGHIKDRPRKIKLSILPEDQVRIDDLLAELVEAHLIEREGGWIMVPNLSKHQRIDRRYFLTCDRDGCTKPDPFTDETDTSTAPATTGTRRGHALPRDEGEGEGEGEGEVIPVVTSVGANSATDVAPPTRSAPKRGTRLPADFKPSEKSRQIALTECPGIDLLREHSRFVDYWTGLSGQKAVKVDWDATWRNWMRRAADDLKGKPRSRQDQTEQLFDAAMQRARAADAAEAAGQPIEGVIL